MELDNAIVSADWLVDEGDELEPLTKTACRRLESHGISMTGEEVRRLVRKAKMPTQKINGKIMARADDIDKLVRKVTRAVEGKAQRSGARQS